MEKACEVFKAISEPTRLRIFRILLTSNVSLCGQNFVKVLNKPSYALSKHLKILRTVGLLKEKKEGIFVYFSIKEHDENFYKLLIKSVQSIEDTTGTFEKDTKRLKEILENKNEKT